MPRMMTSIPAHEYSIGIRGAYPRAIIVLLSNSCIGCNLQCPDPSRQEVFRWGEVFRKKSMARPKRPLCFLESGEYNDD
jgi:hypothetical protein